jgi:hypothetical protein
LSIQPDIRTIIIEQMSSPPNQTRIFRYWQTFLKNEIQHGQQERKTKIVHE